jgi:hypothetical protein
MENNEYLAAKKELDKKYASKLFELEVEFCAKLHNDYVKELETLNLNKL